MIISMYKDAIFMEAVTSGGGGGVFERNGFSKLCINYSDSGRPRDPGAKHDRIYGSR